MIWCLSAHAEVYIKCAALFMLNLFTCTQKMLNTPLQGNA